MAVKDAIRHEFKRRFTLELLESRQLLTQAPPGPIGFGELFVQSIPSQVSTAAAAPVSTKASAASGNSSASIAVPSNNTVLSSSSSSPSSAIVVSRKIQVGGSIDTIALTGSGRLYTRMSRSGLLLTLLGTNASSQLTITQSHPARLGRIQELTIARLNVRTGEVGTIDAGAAILNGPTVGLDSVGSLAFGAIGPKANLNVDGNLSGLSAASVNLGPSGQIHVTGDVTSPIELGTVNLSGGNLDFARDVTGGMAISGDLTASQGGSVVIGRDLASLAVGGNVTLGAGSTLSVGRNLGGLTIGGNLDTSLGGQVNVGGNLNALSVTGVIHGRESEDIIVGLNLGSISVQGGQANSGGLDKVDLDVAKDIEAVAINQGIFNSRITAGVQIDGGSTTGANIGPDGPDAVFDSTITAGISITNLKINGDVKSDRPTNPSGGFTRIVAGVDRAGNYEPNGYIDNFQIFGNLIDAVLAASVKPNGGNGTVTNAPTNAPGDDGFDTYDAPAGTITRTVAGANGSPITLGPFKNYTAPPYDQAVDPTIDDAVLPGAINLSFAVQPTSTNPNPFPSKSTVTGSVISTPHGDEADYAGIFAADTAQVFVGLLPQSAG